MRPLLTFLSPGAACSTLNPSVRNGVPMVKRRSFNAFLETVTSTLNTHTIVGKTNGKCWSAVLKYRSLLFDHILPRPQINNVESQKFSRHICMGCLRALVGKTPSRGRGNPLLPSCEPIRRPLASHRPRLVSLGALANNVQTHQQQHNLQF